jgi:hypothetical protein
MIDHNRITIPKLTVEEIATLQCDAAKRGAGEVQSALVIANELLYEAYDNKLKALRELDEANMDIAKIKSSKGTLIESGRIFKTIAARE